MKRESLDHMFESGRPEQVWLDSTRRVLIALDEYPADAHHHLMVMIRTPDAARDGERLPWCRLPEDIRTAGRALVDLLTRHLYDTVVPHGQVPTIIESGRSVIEPHVHVLVDGKPESLWREGRYGDDATKLDPAVMQERIAEIGFDAVAAEAEALFAGVNWASLGEPQTH